MGLIASFVTQPCIEKVAFPAPKKSSYTIHHPNITFIGRTKTEVIACMKYTPQNLPINSRKIIIYSHGNACDIGQTDTFLAKLSAQLETEIISYDYPGYGLSTGFASEKSALYALDTVYTHLAAVGYKHIVLYGVSIGTGPTVSKAVQLSKQKHIIALKGCVLQTPYTSVVGVVSQPIEHILYSTESSICKNPNIFKSQETIDQITVPVTIIHGTKDEVIPYHHAVTLYDCLQQAQRTTSRLITLPEATHNSIEEDYYSELVACLAEMLK